MHGCLQAASADLAPARSRRRKLADTRSMDGSTTLMHYLAALMLESSPGVSRPLPHGAAAAANAASALHCANSNSTCARCAVLRLQLCLPRLHLALAGGQQTHVDR